MFANGLGGECEAKFDDLLYLQRSINGFSSIPFFILLDETRSDPSLHLQGKPKIHRRETGGVPVPVPEEFSAGATAAAHCGDQGSFFFRGSGGLWNGVAECEVQAGQSGPAARVEEEGEEKRAGYICGAGRELRVRDEGPEVQVWTWGHEGL